MKLHNSSSSLFNVSDSTKSFLLLAFDASGPSVQKFNKLYNYIREFILHYVYSFVRVLYPYIL